MLKKLLKIVALVAFFPFTAKSDCLSFVDNPPAGKIIASFDFNNAESLSDAVYVNPVIAKISSDKSETLDQTPALVARVNSGAKEEWNIAFEIKPGYMQPYKYYRVTFDYKILEAAPEGGQVYFAVRPDKKAYATSYLGNEVGIKKRKIYDVVPGEESKCGFRVGIQKSGAIAIDNVKIEELPTIATENVIKLQPVGKGGTWKDIAGMATHLSWLNFYKTDEEVIKMLDLLQNLGIGMIRFTFSWQELFPQSFDQADERVLKRLDLVVNEAQKRNIQILGLVGLNASWAVTNPSAGNESRCYPAKDIRDYEKFIRYVGTRYKGKVQHWEIYNEPDLPHFWRAPFSEYIAELKAASKTLKEIDPKNYIINGGLSTVLFRGRNDTNVQTLYDLLDPEVAKYYDALTLHIYPWNTDEMIYNINNVVALMKEKKVDKKIWLTEIGYSVFAKRTDEDQANFLEASMLKLAAHPQVERIFIYNEKVKSEHKNAFERGLGIINGDYTPRASYLRLKKLYSGGVPEKIPAFAGENR